MGDGVRWDGKVEGRCGGGEMRWNGESRISCETGR